MDKYSWPSDTKEFHPWNPDPTSGYKSCRECFHSYEHKIHGGIEGSVSYDDRTQRWIEDDIQVRNLKDELYEVAKEREELQERVYDLEYELRDGREELQERVYDLEVRFEKYKKDDAIDKKVVQEAIEDRAVYETSIHQLRETMIQNFPDPQFLRCWEKDYSIESLPLMLRDFLVMIKGEG